MKVANCAVLFCGNEHLEAAFDICFCPLILMPFFHQAQLENVTNILFLSELGCDGSSLEAWSCSRSRPVKRDFFLAPVGDKGAVQIKLNGIRYRIIEMELSRTGLPELHLIETAVLVQKDSSPSVDLSLAVEGPGQTSTYPQTSQMRCLTSWRRDTPLLKTSPSVVHCSYLERCRS